MKFPLLAQDKANHCIAGGIAGLSAAACAVQLGHPEQAGWAASGAALAAGIVKELADWLANEAVRASNNEADMAAIHACQPLPTPQPLPHSVDPLDLLATWFGGWFVQAVAWVVVP